MRYLALDIATNSGWSFFEDNKIVEMGTIQLLPQMDLPQKLHYFHLELKRLIDRLNPEYAFVEDVILGISGAKTMSYLARLNGVAICTLYSAMQEKVKLYTPTYWKSHSFDGLSGMAKKYEIQLAVVKSYNIPIVGNFGNVDAIIKERDDFEKQIKSEHIILRTRLNQLKSSLTRKKNPLGLDEELYTKNQIKETCTAISNGKSALKKKEKELDKKFLKICIDISSQTGITTDIADSIGIGYCGYKELINATNTI